MSKVKVKNPLLEDTDQEVVEEANVSEEMNENETADGTLENHMSSSIADLESHTGETKNSILRSIDEIRIQMEDERTYNEALKKDLEDAQRALREKEAEFEKLAQDRDSDVKSLNNEIDGMKVNLGTLEGLKDEVTFANDELKNAQGNIDDLKTVINDKESSIKDLQGRLISAEEEKSKLLGELKSEVGSSRNLQKELSDLSRDRDNISREKDILMQKYTSLEGELKRLREESEALEEIQNALSQTKKISKR